MEGEEKNECEKAEMKRGKEMQCRTEGGFGRGKKRLRDKDKQRERKKEDERNM